MSNDNVNTDDAPKGVRWQLPTEPFGKKGKRSVRFDKAPDEVKRAFTRLYPVSYNKEIAEWFGINVPAVRKLACELRLRKDLNTLCKRRYALTRLRYGNCNPLEKIRKCQPERYADICRRKSETMKRHWRVARADQLHHLGLGTKLRVGLLSKSAAKLRYHMATAHNYFYDLDRPWDICYDSQTRRRPVLEQRAVEMGFRIVEGEG